VPLITGGLRLGRGEDRGISDGHLVRWHEPQDWPGAVRREQCPDAAGALFDEGARLPVVLTTLSPHGRPSLTPGMHGPRTGPRPALQAGVKAPNRVLTPRTT